jgi:hypothetical protein
MPNKTTRKRRCNIYKTCEEVPCGEMMNRCRPSYCISGSKNWGSCNMKNWGNGYSHLEKNCKSEKNCRMKKPKSIVKYQVDVEELHNKMPYIWRFLDRKTRRKIISLAQKPLNEINIIP